MISLLLLMAVVVIGLSGGPLWLVLGAGFLGLWLLWLELSA